MARLAQNLRDAVLRAALEGKLTDRLSTDNDIKSVLIQSGVIPTNIEYDNYPYEIPSKWIWTDFRSFANIHGTGLVKPKSEQHTDAMYYYFKMNNIENFTGKCNYNDMVMIDASEDEFEKYRLRDGDFLFNTRNSRELVGKTAVAHDVKEKKIILNNNILRITFPDGIIPDYINLFFVSSLGRDQLKDFISNTTNVAAIYKRQLVTMLVPLASSEEQKRIVDRVDELMVKIDEFEAIENELEALKIAFPGEMKKALLQAALRGSLTNRAKDDTPVERLLQDIKGLKKKLIDKQVIRDGGVKYKTEQLDKPFDIPSKWEWVCLNEIAYLSSGNKYEEESNGCLYIKVADMNLPENASEITTSTRFVNGKTKGAIMPGSIIFPKRGGAISTNKKRKVLREKIYIDSNTMAMTAIDRRVFDYMKHWFDSVDLSQLQTGTSVPQINNKDIYPMLIPIPPIEEQQRIVDRLDALLPLCDELEKLNQ